MKYLKKVSAAQLISASGTIINSMVTGDDPEVNAPSISAVLNAVYPIGSIYMSVNNTNPSTFIGGTWVAWGAGRVPVGVDTSDSAFDTAEETGGEKTHILTEGEMPTHSGHLQVNSGIPNSGSANAKFLSTMSTHGEIPRGWNDLGNEYYPAGTDRGSSQAHNNLQPYITCYMFKRTA